MQILASKDRKARKEHRCDFCGETIKKGEVYDWSKLIEGGTLYEWKSHEKCDFLCSQLWDYAGHPDEGMDEELFRDSLHSFSQAFVCPDCEKWDRKCQCCDDDLEYCIDKAYDLLQTHTLCRTGLTDWWENWALRPRTAEERKAISK